MKKTYTLITLLFVTLMLSGQSRDVKKNSRPDRPGIGHYDQMMEKGIVPHPGGTKAALAAKQQLDSLLTGWWNPADSRWEIIAREEFSYDTLGKLSLYSYYEWDETGNTWEADMKEEYGYDGDGNLLQYKGYSWDSGNSRWVPEDKEEYSRDASGNLTLNLEFSWDDAGSQWVNENKKETSYNATGNVSRTTEYDWDEPGSQWEASVRVDYSYDTKGNQTELIEFLWDEAGSQWVNSYRVEFTYDAQGMRIEILYSGWDGSGNRWVDWYLDSLTYDAQGNMTEVEDYYWDGSSTWLPYYKDQYGYDSKGNPTLEIYADWDTDLLEYLPYSRYEYNYDLSLDLTDLYLPFLDWFEPDHSEQIVNKPLDYTSLYRDDADNSWLDDYKTSYYYSDLEIVSVLAEERQVAHIFPNPFMEYLNINLSDNNQRGSFELYDIRGRRVMYRELSNSETFSMAGLKEGIYFYRLTVEGVSQKGKLLKK